MKLRSVICGNDLRETWLHCRAYQACDKAEPVGIICENEGNSQVMGLRSFGSFEEILEDKNIDIVEILASSPDRLTRALETLEAGKHLLLSPPIGEDPDGAKKISMTSNKSHGLLMVAENWKFFPPVEKLGRLVRKKAVGRITSLRMRTVLAGAGGWDPYLNPDFRNAEPEPDFDYSMWLLREIYEKLSIACEFMGAINEIYCIDRETGGGRASVVTWQHASHALYGALDITYAPKMNIRSAYYPRDDNMELTGASGIIWLTLACSQMKSEPTLRIYRGENQFAYGNLEDDWLRSYENTLDHFTDCVSRGRTPAVSSKEAAKIMKYASAAMESASTGKRIKF